MEYDRVQRQQRKRFGFLLVLGGLAFGAFFLWYGQDSEEAPTRTAPPSAAISPGEQDTEGSVTAPVGVATPEAEPPTARPETSSLPGPEHDLPQQARPQADTPTEEREERGSSPAEPEDVQQTRDEALSSPAQTGVIRASRLNVRQQPSVAADRINVLSRGEQVTILSEKDDWYRIQAQDGELEGWVAKRYVDTDTAHEVSHSS